MSTIETVTSVFSQTGPLGIQPVVKRSATEAYTPQRYRQPSDTAATLAQSTQIKANQEVISGAVRNAGKASSVIETAQAGLSKIEDALTRMKEIAEAAESTSLSDQDRGYFQLELDNLRATVDEIVHDTTYEGTNLLDGTYNKLIQIGEFPPIIVEISFDDASADTLFAGQATSVVSAADASVALARIEDALGNLGEITGQASGLTANVEAAVQTLQETAGLRAGQAVSLTVLSDHELSSLALDALTQDAALSTLAQARGIEPPLLEQTLSTLAPLDRKPQSQGEEGDVLSQAQEALRTRQQESAEEVVTAALADLSINSATGE